MPVVTAGPESPHEAEAVSSEGWQRVDWLAALVVGLIGGGASVAVLTQVHVLFFYQSFTPEVVYAACGSGFGHPGDIPAALHDFLLARAPSFDCAALQDVPTLQPLGLFARLQLYLSYVVVALWGPPTLRYIDLWPLVGLLGGAYAAGGFALFRLFFRWKAALLGGLLIAISPLALSLVVSFRDYSKAPFFIWGVVFLLCAIRARTPLRACGWSALAGSVVGIGIGFRIDLVVLLLAGCLSLLVVTNWRDLLARVPAAAVFAIVTLAAGWPIFAASPGASSGTLLMQGLSDPYQRFLGLGAVPYGLGGRYSDELVLSSVAAKLRPVTPGWDAGERDALYAISQSMTRSGEEARAWMPLFVGDLATQGLKSLAWIAAMPALMAEGRPPDPGFGGLPRSKVTAPGLLVYGLLGHAWLVPLALAGLIAFGWRELAFRPRTLLPTIVLFGLMAASTVVQFSARHVFHLEFVWILALLSLGAAIYERHRLLPVWKPFTASLCVLVVVSGTIYAALLTYQNHALKAAFSDLLALPREPVDEQTRPNGSAVVMDVGLPAARSAITRAPDDSMDPGLPLRGIQWDVRAEADRLVLSMSGCPAGRYVARLEYATTATVWQPFDEEIEIVVGEEDGTTQLVFTAFYRPTQYLSHVSVEPFSEACDIRLERINGTSPLPYLLTARFPPNWQDSFLFRRLGGFGGAPW
jgi:hypothetical protein